MLRTTERQDIIEGMLIKVEADATSELEEMMDSLRDKKQMFSEEQLKTIEGLLEAASKGAARSGFWTGLDTGKELEG